MADVKTRVGRWLSQSDLDKLDSARPDLDRAFKVLSAKLPEYNNLWDYYDGDQPLMYTARRMRDLFEDLDLSTFVENWCAVVIDSANDRINLNSITVKDESTNNLLQEVWEDLEMNLEASDIHEAALVIGEAYVIVWPSEEDETERLQVFYNDPRLVHLFYDPSNPRKKWYGGKWWVDRDLKIRMNLYYDDRIEYYKSVKKAKSVASSKGFQPYSPEDIEGGEIVFHDYEEVPIFHARIERRKLKGDLVNVIPLQNAINKLVTDMMVAAEFGAFKQRWIVSQADASSLKNAPNIIWEIPAGDGVGESTQVGEFDATELSNYISAVDHLASSAAIISRTPKHYLFQQTGEVSGEALIAMEAPLNKRCTDHINKFTPVWKDIARFMLKVLGAEVKKTDIEVLFDKPETIQPKTQAEIRKAGKDSGIPLKTLLRDEGRSEAWLDQMGKDKKEEMKEQSVSLGQALMRATRASGRPLETE